MAEIVMDDGNLAACDCDAFEIEPNFEILPHPELPEYMAFCAHCGRGRALSQWTAGVNVGVMTKKEFIDKYQLNIVAR